LFSRATLPTTSPFRGNADGILQEQDRYDAGCSAIISVAGDRNAYGAIDLASVISLPPAPR
jgi:hypothetical protein